MLRRVAAGKRTSGCCSAQIAHCRFPILIQKHYPKVAKTALVSIEEVGIQHTLVPNEALIPTVLTPDFPYIHKELLKNIVTLKLL